MTNLQLMEKLSKTSVFNEAALTKLLVNFKENMIFDSKDIDHLAIRQQLSGKARFPDAQADYQCQKS